MPKSNNNKKPFPNIFSACCCSFLPKQRLIFAAQPSPNIKASAADMVIMGKAIFVAATPCIPTACPTKIWSTILYKQFTNNVITVGTENCNNNFPIGSVAKGFCFVCSIDIRLLVVTKKDTISVSYICIFRAIDSRKSTPYRKKWLVLLSSPVQTVCRLCNCNKSAFLACGLSPPVEIFSFSKKLLYYILYIILCFSFYFMTVLPQLPQNFCPFVNAIPQF